MGKIKIPKGHKIQWINHASAYIHAAEVIFNKIKQTSNLSEHDKWENKIVTIPFLFLLRQALETSIKSISISYEEGFDSIHDLNDLLQNAEKVLREKEKNIDLDLQDNKNKWEEVKVIVNEFVETTYGGERMFKVNDSKSFALRYLQMDGDYSKLKYINHEKLIKDVKRANVLCEAFSIFPSFEIYK